jgi:hypothetical protein
MADRGNKIIGLVCLGAAVTIGWYSCSPSNGPQHSAYSLPPDADLTAIKITADSPLWYQDPDAATWLVKAQSEDMQAVFSDQENDTAEAARHRRNAQQDRDLARQSLAKRNQ